MGAGRTGDACTVVLAPAGDASGRARDILDGWVQRGLIEPPLWQEIGEHGARSLRWLGRDRQPADLRTALGSEPYTVVRTLVLTMGTGGAGGGGADPAGFLATARSIIAEIDAALAPNQRFRRLNLAVPAADGRPLELDIFRLPHDANIVVAPESRVSPAHASRSVDTDELPAHAAATIAAVGALWPTMGTAPFDEDEAAGAATPTVHVVRVFGRALQIDGVLTEVAQEALNRRRSDDWVASAAGGALSPHPPSVIEDTLDHFLGAHGERFSFRAPDGPPMPRRQTSTILQAFAAMFTFIFRGLKELPSKAAKAVVDATQRRLSSFAQRVTYGDSSMVAVVYGGRRTTAGRRRETEHDATQATSSFAEQLLRQVTGESPTPVAMGGVWGALRRTAFMLHDGSEPPTDVPAPMDGAARSIIADARQIAPDPAAGPLRLTDVPESFDAIVHAPIRPCDPYQARLVDHVLAAGGKTEPPTQDKHLDGASDPQPGRDDPSTPPDEHAPSGSSELEDADQEDDDLDAAARLRQELRAWVEQREASLLWQLSERAGEALDHAQQTLFQVLRQVAEGESEINQDAMRRERSRLRRSWGWITGIVFAISVGLFFLYGPLGVIAGLPLVAGHALGSLAVWLIALLWRFIRYQRQMFRLKHEHDRRHAAYVHALRLSPELAQQVVALASACEQLREWSEIIGWVLHHPEGPTPVASSHGFDAVPVETPPGTVVVTGRTDDRSRLRVGTKVGRELFGTGWLGRLYDRYQSASMEAISFSLGVDELPDPDWDLNRPWPCSQLLEDLRSGNRAAGWSREVLERVATALSTTPPEDINLSVDGTPVEAEAFLASILTEPHDGEELCRPMWSDAARMSQHDPRIVRTHLWGPVTLSGPATEPPAVRREASGVRRPDADVFAYEAIRLDSTAAVSATALRVFAAAEPPERTQLPRRDEPDERTLL